jgi:hypothetical protein
MPSELPYMPVKIAEAIADAEGLTNEQLGALERIRRVLWHRISPETTAPMLTLAEVRAVSRLGKRWAMAGPGLMAKLTVIDGMVSCPLVNDVLARTRLRRSQRVAAGRASAASRGSEAARNGDSEGARKSHNPLKSPGLDPDLVGIPFQRAPTNENEKGEKPAQKSTGMSTQVSTAQARKRHETLFVDGVTLMMERTRCTRLQATKSINAWLGMLDGDAGAVAQLLAKADAENLSGHAFGRMVAQWTETAERERTRGLSLPLGPVVAPRKQGAGR